MVEPGGALKKAIEKVIDDDGVGRDLQGRVFDRPFGITQGQPQRKQGRWSGPTEAVNFTVELTPNTIAYFLLGYNVTGVELYRKRENEAEFTAWKAMDSDRQQPDHLSVSVGAGRGGRGQV